MKIIGLRNRQYKAFLEQVGSGILNQVHQLFQFSILRFEIIQNIQS